MKLKNDPLLDVATANSRRAKVWKNKKMLWSAIVERMSSTTRTPETVAEYRKMSRDQQSEIKDTGGIVGGYCVNGRRTDVRSRSILALDADYAETGLWEDYQLLYGSAAAIYSTHKHTPEKPRLRLMIPLAREVSPDEFQAIGRRVAADLGIDQFDDTTYQAQRLMFWPSTSQDGEFVFHYCDGPVMNPDEVLGRYSDWRDISAWPMSSRVTEIIKKNAAVQADPLTKPGLVGAFCRAYSIEEAIAEFVPEYEPCGAGRYTYTGGTSAAGVTTYDGKFSYSFHATDPASGQLCNAFDLVRLHKFGAMDADVDPSKPVTSRPSWKAMCELASSDPRSKVQAVEDIKGEFSELPATAEDWRAQLRLTEKGAVASTIENIVIILNNDPDLAGKLTYDEMVHTILSGRMPWRDDAGPWLDSDDSALRFYLEKNYGLSGKDKIFDAVNVCAMEHKFHPVREYLDGCEWDGVERLDRLLVEYLGAEDNAYVRAVTRKTFVAAAARIYKPGVKFDYMLTLRGRQGLGKSSLIQKLGGRWYSDSFSTIQGKDSYEQLQGVWFMEVGELAGMRKAEAEIIKLYISKQCDRFRPAYGRRTQEFPRQCIFIGTTNESQFLRDATGNRRFWVVDTPNKPKKSVWADLPQEVIDLIWGEAVARYREGEDLFLGTEMEAWARTVQAAYEEENPKVGIITGYMERMLPPSWENMDLYARRTWLEGPDSGTVERYTVSAIEVYAEALGGNPEKLDRYAIKEINDILCQLPGWRRMGSDRITVPPYGRQRYYKKEI